MGKLDGKVALITGAGQGVGQGVAFALAKEGASVAVAGRTESKLVVTCNEIAERGGRAEPVLMDIADADSITGAVARTVELFGGVDILINNASLNPLGNVLDLTPERLADGIDVRPRRDSANHASLLPVHEGARRRGNHQHGQLRGRPLGRCRLRRLRGREGIRPSPQSRGSMRMGRRRDPGQRRLLPTRRRRGCSGGQMHARRRAAAFVAGIPLRRIGDCETDIGTAVAFLVGPDAAYLTGATIPLDGGQSRWG